MWEVENPGLFWPAVVLFVVYTTVLVCWIISRLSKIKRGGKK